MTPRQKDTWDTAVHEAGHVLVAVRFHVPVRYVCIRRNWRIRSGGYMQLTYPDPIQVNGYPFSPWISYSRVILAGRVADRLNNRCTKQTIDVRRSALLLWEISWDNPVFEQLSKDERVNQVRRDVKDTHANLHKLFTKQRPNHALCHLSQQLYRRRILRRADLLVLRPRLARKGTACMPVVKTRRISPKPAVRAASVSRLKSR